MTLDADAQKVLDLIVELKRPPFETVPVEEAREAYRNSREALQPPPRPISETRDVEAPGPGGPIPMRLYRNSIAAGPLPVLVYFHGGGWVIGDLESHDGICREMAHRSRFMVIAVDYRLAPEHKFPAAVDDAFAAVKWISRNAGQLGIDASRLSIGGDSAGGTLAVVVAMMAKEIGAPVIKSQVLVYPVTDLTMSKPSHQRLAKQAPIPQATLKWFYECYLANEQQRTDWKASPLLAEPERFKGLPPTLILTAGYDPLGDEGLALGEAMQAAGTKVENARFEGQIHGFLTMGRLIGQTDAAHDAIATFLKKKGR